MAAADSSSEYETSGVSGSTESLDLSCIHWGYLNCTLVTDPKKIKDNVWQTYWVDLCGSTIRLYKDLSLPPNSASQLPPSSLIGPSNENEKKEAFIILKKGAEVAIVEPEIEPYKSRKRLRVNKRHAFKVTFANKGANCPAYVFQAPSKGSMYRWISKIEEGIDMADKPQNESATVLSALTSALTYLRGYSFKKKLKEAKLLSMEQRRFQMAPKLRYLEKDDVDSGMEGDVEEAYEVSQKSSEDVFLEDLRKRLQEKEQLVRQLDREERAFLGPENSTLVRRCEFQSTTNKDYYLIPGHPLTLLPRGSELTILGQLSNNRWRCFVELPRHASTEFTNGLNSETSSEVESASSFDISDDNTSDSKPETEMLIGSVPSSLLVELRLPSAAKIALKYDDGTPIASPEETPQLSPFPSPPPSPYSSHKSDRTSLQNRSSLRRSIASENLSEHDIWEQFCIPSPPSSPATSRTTSPSLSPSGSPAGSLEALDFDVDTSKESSAALKGNELLNYPQVKLRSGGSRGRNQRGNVTDTKKHREAILMDELTGSEPELDGDRLVTVIDVVPPEDLPSLTEEFAQETVRMRVKQRQSTEGKTVSDSLGEPPRNYAFLVTKKLRQRGISLIVGSSSSEDEGEDGEVARVSPRITRRKLDEEFTRFEGEAPEREIRPYSAFVSRKRAGIKLAAGSSNFVPRTSTRDELLRDYSSPSQKSPALRGNTCTTLGKLGDWSSPENAPPINQRRTLQMIKTSSEGFGFTLQTYGIVQQEGQVEYMTFVLNVEEDGPAYMAGLRPGDVILEVDGKNVEEVDHKEVVTLIHQTTESVRLVVVFVDALRRMKLNTRLKILSVELGNKEVEFGELCKSEEAILTGRGAVTVDLSTLELTHGRERTNSYLYTTELTSSFAKESPEVHDSLLQYRQTTHDRPRPCSMPDQSELSRQSGKSSIIATTGSEMLKNFASSDLNNQRRTLSSKLMKTFSKKRKSVESFKSYVELDSGDQGAGDEKADEAGSDTSSLSSTSGVCEWPVTSAEPTVAVSTTLERKTEASEAALPQAPPAICTIVERKTEASAAALSQAPPANVPVSCNLSDNGSRGSEETRNSSPILRRVRDDSDVSNGSRIMPGIAQMHRRFEKSATANNSTSTTSRPMPAKEKPKNGSLPTQALKGPQLQRARMSPRPESYLLAMDAAGQEPLIPNEGKNNSAETIMSESGT